MGGPEGARHFSGSHGLDVRRSKSYAGRSTRAETSSSQVCGRGGR